MISISTQTASEYFVVLEEKPESKIDRLTRRVSRIATLDAGAVINDSGYTDKDRALIIEADVTAAQKEILDHMIQNYSRLNVSTKSGFFVCAAQQFWLDNGQIRLIIWVAE